MKQQHPPSSKAQVSGFSPQPSDGLVPKPSDDDDVLVRVENVSKKFCRDLKKSLWYGMKDLGSELIGQNRDSDELRPDEFWAVKDVSFELRRGECLGLIGRNGAGKTTLLRMLNGLIKPDKGHIEMRGRVAALIALGAGFNPILTGRENIYVNAAVLGLSKKEIDEKIYEIIEFSELCEFIDSPVQTYSSGMHVRLGFSIASSLNPNILILDEILAVGDAAFRDKCYHRIAKIRKNTAVIFVSHNMEQVARISTTSIFLKNGTAIAQGSVTNCINYYNKIITSFSKPDNNFLSLHPPIISFKAFLGEKKIRSGDSLSINLFFTSTSEIKNCLFKILFYNTAGSFSADGVSLPNKNHIMVKKGKNYLKIEIHSIPLKNGVYFIAINMIDHHGDLIIWSYKKHKIEVYGAYTGAIADCHIKFDIIESQISPSRL